MSEDKDVKQVKMVDVIATAEGYDNKAIRREGDVFQMPEGATGSWFRPLTGGKSAPAAPADTGPNAATVIKSIPDMSDEDLQTLQIAEDDREGGARVSVTRAIEAEQKKRTVAKEEAAKNATNGAGEGDESLA